MNRKKSPPKHQLKPNYVSPTNDIPIINEILEMNEEFCELMKQTINKLKNRSFNAQGYSYEHAINKISNCKDLATINDFFTNEFLAQDIEHIHYLKPDHIIKLFPLVLSLIKDNFDRHFKTGIKTAWRFLKLYYDTIVQVKKCAVVNSVDLMREEKIEKYNVIINYFSQLRKNKVVVANVNKNYTSRELNFMMFIKELDYFLKQVK